MVEKLKMPYITETVLVDGVYHAERRVIIERRQSKKHCVNYERRRNQDPRLPAFKPINEVI
ncbi:hypothetical protein HUO09_05325 [Vibrio sp. Y2-5]|nr:hypothetical protein [Vibrio sp. Y2-5]